MIHSTFHLFTNYNLVVDVFTVKRRLRDYRREMGNKGEAMNENEGLFGRSGRVVLTAIIM